MLRKQPCRRQNCLFIYRRGKETVSLSCCTLHLMMARPTVACKVSVCNSVFTPRLQWDSGARGVLSHNCRKGEQTLLVRFFVSTIIKLAIHLLSAGVCIFVGVCGGEMICLPVLLFMMLDVCTCLCLRKPSPTVHPSQMHVVSNHPETAVNLSQSKRLS